MSEDEDQKRIENALAKVEIDTDFPSLVLSVLADVTSEWIGEGQVHVEVQGSLRGHVVIYGCGQKHVHLVLGSECPLYVINAALVLAFGSAVVCAERGEYRGAPERDALLAVIKRMHASPRLAEVGGLDGLFNYVTSNFDDIASELARGAAAMGAKARMVH